MIAKRLLISAATLAALLLLFVFLRKEEADVPLAPQTQVPIFSGLNAQDIRSLQMSIPSAEGAVLTLGMSGDGVWRLSGDAQPVDQEQVSIILSVVAQLTFNESLDMESLDLAEIGLGQPPDFLLELITADQQRYTLRVGRPVPESTDYYARVGDLQRILIIDRGPIDFLVTQVLQPPLAQS